MDIFVLQDPGSYSNGVFHKMTDIVSDFEFGVDKVRVEKEWADKG